MTEPPVHPALDRVLRRDGCAEALRVLGSELSGADATTLLLATMARRAADLGPGDVLARYRTDRFVAPAPIDPIELARLTLWGLEAMAPAFDPVELAPLAPLGSHSVFARVAQNNVVTTIRQTEVAADPTNQLALEAAVRRQRLLADHPRSDRDVRLCAVHRVVRAQAVDGPRSFAHFGLLGVVVAGRGRSGQGFEADALVGTLDRLARFVVDVTDRPVRIDLTDFGAGASPPAAPVVERVVEGLTAGRVRCIVDGSRTHGRGYYPGLCFKLLVDAGDETIELGDGGLVDWSATLLQNRKERLLIGGVSLDRLALVRAG